MSIIRRIAFVATLLGAGSVANAFSFDQDSYYISSGRTISQLSSEGNLLDTIRPIGPSSLGTEIRGIAFGGDGLLYAVRNNTGQDPAGVDVVDASGKVQRSYTFDSRTDALNFGTIAFASDGRTFYVGGISGVFQFDTQNTDQGTKVIDRGANDLAVLPNGDIIMATEYSIARYKQDGTLLSSIDALQDPQHLTADFNDFDDISLTNVRGIAYDANSDTTYVSMLGYAGASRTDMKFKVMALDGFSDQLKGITYYWYAADLFFSGKGELLAGSSVLPGVVDVATNSSKSLGTKEALFVTALPPIPEASTGSMMALGLCGVFALAASRRRD
jgi:hypothetical protein